MTFEFLNSPPFLLPSQINNPRERDRANDDNEFAKVNNQYSSFAQFVMVGVSVMSSLHHCYLVQYICYACSPCS